MDKTRGYFSTTTTYHRKVRQAARALEAPHNGPIGALASNLGRKVSIFADLRPICLPRMEYCSAGINKAPGFRGVKRAIKM